METPALALMEAASFFLLGDGSNQSPNRKKIQRTAGSELQNENRRCKNSVRKNKVKSVEFVPLGK